MELLTAFFATFAQATIANPTFLKEFGLLIAAAAIMKPLLTKAIEAGIDKAALKNNEYVTQVANKVTQSMDELTKTMKDNNAQTEKRIQANEANSIEHAKEISALATSLQKALRQITAYAEHVRYLYTKMQLPPPSDEGEDDNKKQH